MNQLANICQSLAIPVLLSRQAAEAELGAESAALAAARAELRAQRAAASEAAASEMLVATSEVPYETHKG